MAAEADAASWAWRNPLPQGNTLYAMAASASLLVAVGEDGAIVTSPDGINWTARTSGTTYSLFGVAWSGTRFVAVGGEDEEYDTGIVLSSTDGVTWTRQYAGDPLWNVKWLGSRFVAFGGNGIGTSPDGVIWTLGTLTPAPAANAYDWDVNFSDVAWSGSQYVAVEREYTIWTSPNGATWTSRQANIGEDVSLDAISWAAGKFVAVGSRYQASSGTETAAILTSSDGVTWTDHSPAATRGLAQVMWAGTQFVASGNGTILTSPDAITWTTRYADADRDFSGGWPVVAWSGSRSFVMGYESVGNDLLGSVSALLTSGDNGVTWTRQNPGVAAELDGLAWYAGKFVAVGDAGIALSSPDGVAWTQRTPAPTRNDLDYVNWTGTQFEATGPRSANLSSPDGVTWTSQLLGAAPTVTAFVAWSGTNVVAVGSGGTILTSPDRVVWTPQQSGTAQDLNGVAWSGTKFVAVGTAGTVLTSATGVTWTPQEPDTGADLNGVAWSGTQFAAVGSGGTIQTSADGITWTSQYSPTRSALYHIVWNGTQFVATFYGGGPLSANSLVDCLTSTDGVTWAQQTGWGPDSYAIANATWMGSAFVALGQELYGNGMPILLASVDGRSWLECSRSWQGLPWRVTGISWSGNRVVAVGEGGAIMSHLAPTTAITPLALAPNVSTPYRATYSEFEGDEVTVTNDRLVTLDNAFAGIPPTEYMASESASFAGASWLPYNDAPDFTLSAGDGQKTVYLKVRGGGVTSSVISARIKYDTTAPTVTVNQAVGQADPTSQVPIYFTVVFSEPFDIFDGDNVTLGGTAGASDATVTEIAPFDGTTFRVAVSGMEGPGTVMASIEEDAGGQDLAGNALLASTSTDNSVTYQGKTTVTLAVANQNSWPFISEGGGVATVTAALAGPATLPVTVNLAFSGSATLNSDYTRSGTVITIPSGSLTGSVTVTALPDAVEEGGETVVVAIASVTNGTESGDQQVSVTIQNITPPVLVASDIQLAVCRGGTVAVDAVYGVRYMKDTDPTHGTAVFDSWAGGKVVYTHNGDDTSEDSFTYHLNAGQTDSNVARVTITIVPNDIYVDDTATGSNNGRSWTNAFTDLQSGLSAAAPGVTIHIAEGTYKPTIAVGGTGVRHRSFQMRNGVSLLGGYPNGGGVRDPVAHPSILSGDIGIAGNTTDNCYHVFYHPAGTNLDATAVLDGCTITGGQADAYVPHNAGGGMYNSGSCPTLTNVTFSANNASGGGGGLYNARGDYMGLASQSQTTLTGCTFTTNNAAGDGGGLYNDASSPTVTSCVFRGNHAGYAGGGMYSVAGTSGGAAASAVVNCLFSGNVATCGGGVYNAATAILTNCTLSGNRVSTIGGGLYNYRSATVELTNCILWGNTATASGPQLYGGSQELSYSCIEGGDAGAGNITANPQFVDANGADNSYGTADDNLRLQAGSPCIDAGTTYVSGLPDTDLDGFTRRLNDPATNDTGAGYPAIDMGAYEFRPAQVITFPELPDQLYGAVIQLPAYASSDLPVTYVSSDTTVATIDGDTLTVRKVGTATITASQAGNESWAPAVAVVRTLKTTPAPLTCTAVAKTRAYGSANPILSVTYLGLQNADTRPLNQAVAACAARTTSGIGAYPITLSGGSDPNYTLTLVNATLTVTPRTLTATAEGKSRLVGTLNPQFTVRYTGFVNGDDANDLTTTPAASCAADMTSPAGAYPIVVAGGTDENYALQRVNGTLTVLQRARLRLWVNDGAGDPMVLDFGEEETATNGFDAAWDMVAPVAQPGRVSAWLFNPQVTDLGKQCLVSDVRPCRATTRWRLNLAGVPALAAGATLTWDVTAATPGREVYLQELSDEQPVGFPTDLRQLTQPQVVTADTQFEIAYAAPVPSPYVITLLKGWNLVGNPIMSRQSAVELLGTDAGDPVNLGPVWTGEQGGYTAWDTAGPLSPELGFWLYSPTDSQLRGIAGVRADGLIRLMPGWNLVSPAADRTMPDTRGINAAWYWDAARASYLMVRPGQPLEAGHGYWISVTGTDPVLIPLGE